MLTPDSRTKEWIAKTIAWMLPEKVVLWAFVRVMAHATQQYSDKNPDQITYTMAWAAWDKRRGQKKGKK